VTRRPLRVLAATFAGFFLLYAAWSIATPLMAAPDEPVQMIKAVAVVHGQLIGTQTEGAESAYTVVRVPSVYAHAGQIPACFGFKNLVPASCAPALQGTSNDIAVRIYTGRYPPLYYAIVGLPSLVMSSASGVYAMRLVSAALNALFIALAVTAVATWSRSRLLIVGVAVAVTPAALFFGAVINPSGFEASAAICLWCSALVLALERSTDPPPLLVALVALSGCVTVLVRGLSPLWVAMIGLSVAGLAGVRPVLELARRRNVQIAGAAVVVATGLALLWILHAHTLDVIPSVNPAPPQDGTGQLLVLTFDHTGRFLDEMIGQFGWLDTPAPLFTYLVWFGAIGLLAAGAVAASRGRQTAVFLLVVTAAIVVPVMISTSQAHKEGYVWQGKDSLPFAVGVPLVAAELLGLSGVLDRLRGRLAWSLGTVLALGSALAFAGTLRRYAVGIQGPLDFFSSRWHPPLGFVVLLLLEVAAAAATTALLALLVMGRTVAPAPAHALGAHSARRPAADGDDLADANDLDRAIAGGNVDSGLGSDRAEGDRGG
jgi:hypothetical protein